MSWEPIAPIDQREAIAARIRALVADIPPASALEHHCDRALVRSYLEADDLVPDPDGEAVAALESAMAMLPQVQAGIALYGGTAHLGFSVAHLAGVEAAAELGRVIDPVIVRSLDVVSCPYYDFIPGLAGVGVYALERGDAGVPLATAIVEELEVRSEPRGGGRAWHTAAGLVPRTYGDHPDGMYNLGLSHGAPGCIGFLARCVARGIATERATVLLDAAMAYLLGVAPPRAGGRFLHWETDPPTARLAWCYGDLGIAVAILSAARARQKPEWEALAIELARDCAGRPDRTSLVTEPTLCHGSYGVMHTFTRLHHATGDAVFADAARHWLAHGLALDNYAREGTALMGPGGMALALQAVISSVEPTWDRMLLLDL